MWASPKHLRRSQGRSRCGDAGLQAQAKENAGGAGAHWGAHGKRLGVWRGVRGGIRVALAGTGGVAPEQARETAHAKPTRGGPAATCASSSIAHLRRRTRVRVLIGTGAGRRGWLRG